MPIIRDDKVRYLLHASVDTEAIAEIIASSTSPNWLIGVGDKANMFVARSERNSEFSGKPAVAAFVAQAKGSEGTFEGASAFGDKVLVGYVRSPLTGWLIAANISQSVIEAPLKEALTSLIGFGFVALVLTSFLALWLSGFVTRPLEAMASASRIVGHPEEFREIKTPLRDLATVRDALADSAEQVRDSNALLESRVMRSAPPSWSAPMSS